MEIVKKCDGLPLAIKVVAGVQCTKERTVRAWSEVLQSTAWSTSGLPEEVKGALYLSYEDLPSNLKQCFLYCSLFPEDYLFYRDTITELWIAEGFVKAEGSLTVEETAKEYYEELMMRNSLQQHYINIPDVARKHELLHCLGRYLARDEISFVTKVNEVDSSNGPMKLRRAYINMDYGITDNEMTEILDVLLKQGSLRTLMWDGDLMSENWMDVVFNKLSRLRVLNIPFSEIQRLPDSLGNLIHLRYLNISHSKISMIPETIGNLRNLQFLDIQECEHLSRLPNSIVNLHNLRGLDLFGTKLVGMPVGLGRLQNLHTLWEFTLQSNRAERFCTIEELRPLSSLRFLSIERLECVSRSSEARAAELRNKTKLRFLWLHCTAGLQPSEELEMGRIEEVFEELHPPPSLERLDICGYFGREFPKWMAETSASTSILFPNLNNLHLRGWKYCERLPPCGLLPALEELSVGDVAVSVIEVGPEFSVGTDSGSGGGGRAGIDTSKCAFPRLKTLKFKDMPNWQEWQWDKGTQAMPCLNCLWLDDCPKLMSLPEGLQLHATSLTKLTISGAGSLVKVSDLTVLTTLEVKTCPELQVVENLQSLKRMKLIDYEMKSLPTYLLEGVQRGIKKGKRGDTAHLEKLEIWCSEELARLICQRASSEWPKIQDIQLVHVYSHNRLVLVYNKSPFSFNAEFKDTTSSSSSGMPSSSSDIQETAYEVFTLQ